ncbi:ASCH domain-containing protein [Maribacter sp. 2307ULW6-5]|uniref:ASCH domain-containing protein n=1 Tax=Maribacter sp. 2307ULW6-5 TaxID=3386275 RepID=UPI0039BCF39E
MKQVVKHLKPFTMEDLAIKFWKEFELSNITLPQQPRIISEMAGNEHITNELINLYLSGKKTAGSSLKRVFDEEDFPKSGDYWIVLDNKRIPKCILKTVKVEENKFGEVPLRISVAEGEGDLSLEYWRKAHIEFFASDLSEEQMQSIEDEAIITEHFELVHK